MKKWFLFLALATTTLVGTSGYALSEDFAEFSLQDQRLSGGSPSAQVPPSHYESIPTVYDLLLTIGQDDFLPSSPTAVSTSGFTDFLGWDDATIATFRQSAINWFIERFGIDFSAGIYDPTSGITSISYAILIPIAFSGNYRVYESNNKLIPTGRGDTPSYVRSAEWVVIFTNVTTQTYGGTYGAETTSVQHIDPTDTVDFAAYRINVPHVKNKPHYYDFYSRSYFPNKVAPTNLYPARISETFQLYSPDFGSGAGFLNVANPSTANAQGLWPTFVRGTFSFPIFTLTDLDGYTVSPI
jgi:hypothetical protein